MRPHEDPTQVRDPLPRGLLTLSGLWVVASLALAFGAAPPMLPLASSYAPPARLALLGMLAGVVVGWPVLRFSMTRRIAPRRGVLLDLAVILGVAQIAIWPLRLLANWSIERTLALDLLVSGWALLAACAVLLGTRSDRGSAHNWATALLLAALAAPLLAAPLVFESLEAFLSSPTVGAMQPWVGLYRLADPTERPLTESDWMVAMVPAAAGTAGLIGLLLALRPLLRRG